MTLNTVLIALSAIIAVYCTSPERLTARETPAEREIRAVVESYSNASQNRDLEAYLSYFHPDFLGWYNGDETPTDKKARVRGLTWYFAHSKPIAYTMTIKGIRALGETAIVHYSIEQTLEWNDGRTSETTSHWTDILVRENGRWYLVSDHGGTVATK